MYRHWSMHAQRSNNKWKIFVCAFRSIIVLAQLAYSFTARADQLVHQINLQLRPNWSAIGTDWSTSQLQPHQCTRSIIRLVFIHHHISFDPCALTDEYWSMHTGQCALINVHLLLSSDWCTDQILFWSIHCSIIVQVQYIGQGTLASHRRLLPFPDIALPLPRSMPRLGRNCFAAQIIQEQ